MADVAVSDHPCQQRAVLTLAFCLYKYFPHGGLQRDFLQIARRCQGFGHRIRVYTLTWRDEVPDGFEIHIAPVTALTRHTLYERFNDWMQASLRLNPVDAVIGFNKMPGLDLYYAADSCYEEKARSQRSWPYRQLPRYRHFSKYERAVFDRNSKTEILMISEVQKRFFKRYYQTPEERMTFLYPGVSRDRVAPPDLASMRQARRKEMGIEDDEKVLLLVGSGFKTKGLKRALIALWSLPSAQRQKVHFYVIGDDKPVSFRCFAWLLGISRQVTIIKGSDDVPGYLFASDLFILPALNENSGLVILEAMVAGLPVLLTDHCGYAEYVARANMGQLVSTPFRQSELNQKLASMLADDNRDQWVERGRLFAQTANIFSLHSDAAEVVQRVACSRRSDKLRQAQEIL